MAPQRATLRAFTAQALHLGLVRLADGPMRGRSNARKLYSIGKIWSGAEVVTCRMVVVYSFVCDFYVERMS